MEESTSDYNSDRNAVRGVTREIEGKKAIIKEIVKACRALGKNRRAISHCSARSPVVNCS